ncbi:MAG: AAA family ATPase, partial [marine benthic group bacterium]|nr:AAA family ATPase [Gemmatimonadota bacterium]
MRLSVLGPPELVRVDGSPAGLAPGKTLAVLVYLAHATSPPSRADLARLFWPNSEPSKARHSVRQTFSLLRKVIGEEAFASDDPVKLRPGEIVTDTSEFLEALREGEIETADRLWRGTFAEGLVLADAPEWNRWVEERQLALEHRLCEGLTTEAEAARFRTDAGAEATTADAVALLRRAITIDPYRERPRVVLADLLVKQGKLDEAANEIAEARRALGEDTPDLLQLERLIDAEVSRRYAAGMADAAPSLGELFVGRTAEMARLIGAWARAEQGLTMAAVVEGPAGIGKTRLSRELASHVRGRGGIVAFTSPLPAEANIPGGVLRDLETQLIAGVSGATDERRFAPPDENGDEVTAAERILDLLRRAPAPVLIVVDDLQWADPVTRSVLARVLRQSEGTGRTGGVRRSGCLFAFTVRTEAADREVRETVRALRDRSGSLALELGPLSDDEVRELVALSAHLETFESDGALSRILALAAGSPLYVIELLRTLAETGVLVTNADGQLQLAGPLPDPLPFPTGMRELLETRLRALPDAAVTIAAHLAGARGRAGVDELRDSTGLSAADFSRGLGTLIDRDILGRVGPADLAFAHEEVRRAVVRLYPLAADLEAETARRRRRERRFGWAAMGLAIVPIAVAVLWRLFGGGGTTPETASSPPYGGGTIVLLTESEIVELAPDSGPSDAWDVSRRPLPTREVNEYAGPFLTTAGDRV